MERFAILLLIVFVGASHALLLPPQPVGEFNKQDFIDGLFAGLEKKENATSVCQFELSKLGRVAVDLEQLYEKLVASRASVMDVFVVLFEVVTTSRSVYEDCDLGSLAHVFMKALSPLMLLLGVVHFIFVDSWQVLPDLFHLGQAYANHDWYHVGFFVGKTIKDLFGFSVYV